MYGKLFDSMYDGTLYGQWEALITFQQMIILADADGIIDITPLALSARTGIPIDIVSKGIKVLGSPDPYSRTEGEEGRRIILIDDHRPWGWMIVNHNKYKHLQDADTIREQTKERVRKHREGKKGAVSNDVTDGNGRKQTVTDGNGSKRYTDTDTDIINICSFDTFWYAYPKKQNKKKAQTAFNRLSEKKKLAAIEDIKTRYQDTEHQFIPYASTYLNGERWEDEGNKPTNNQPWDDAI